MSKVHLVRKSRGPDGAAETACGRTVKHRRTTFILKSATCPQCLEYGAAPWVAHRDSEIPAPETKGGDR